MFDFVAPFYNRAMRVAGVTHDRAAQLLGASPDHVILDLGGGTGLGALAAARQSGARALIVDRNARMLSRAPRGRSLQPVRADASVLPLPAGSVDGALCLDALHHFPRPVAALREVNRVLRPGGRLVIEELDSSRISVRVLGRLEHLLGEPGTLWRPDELESMAREAGLEVMQTVIEGITVFLVATGHGDG